MILIQEYTIGDISKMVSFFFQSHYVKGIIMQLLS